jgi:hypothetical protein
MQHKLSSTASSAEWSEIIIGNNARPQFKSTAPLFASKRTTVVTTSGIQANQYATTGTAQGAATTSNAHTDRTFALYAKLPTTELSNALANEPVLHCPLHLERWKHYLSLHNLANKHAPFLRYLEDGFFYNSSISIDQTHIYPHHKSAYDHPEVILEKIKVERAANRYIGPFSPSQLKTFLGRNFIAHPLGVISKSGGKFRVIEDLSWPHSENTPSLNNLCDTSHLSLDWGGMAEAANLIITAPPGSQLAAIDWQDAFHNVGMRPDEWWQGIVQWAGSCDIDRALKFGGMTSSHLFELPASAFKDLLITIWTHLAYIYWVDDGSLCRFPINSSPPWKYDVHIVDILKLAAELGVPFADDKVKPFGFSVKYIGFVWHINTKEVRLPEPKCLSFLPTLQSATNSPSISLTLLRTIVGKLSHYSLIMPLGRVHLRTLWSLQTAMEAKARPNIMWS